MDTGLFIMYGFCCFWQQEYLFMPKLMIAKNRKGNNYGLRIIRNVYISGFDCCWFFHLR